MISPTNRNTQHLREAYSFIIGRFAEPAFQFRIFKFQIRNRCPTVTALYLCNVSLTWYSHVGFGVTNRHAINDKTVISFDTDLIELHAKIDSPNETKEIGSVNLEFFCSALWKSFIFYCNFFVLMFFIWIKNLTILPINIKQLFKHIKTIPCNSFLHILHFVLMFLCGLE